jgi:endogenous inhibitor of DNA gyrase (YacG/DUF329 family)|tara:strand:- start:56 stop:247 length:192 start_codon:yes stop_codon:yes gene_type:complete
MMKKVKCPECKKEVEWSKDSEFKPFCSKRCYMLDLGSWTTEKNKIAGSPLLDKEQDLSKITKH